MTSSHNSKRQSALHPKTGLTPDRTDAERANISSLYSAWLSQKAKIEALLRSGLNSNDWATRSLHDEAIGVEIDVQWAIETEIEDSNDASLDSVRIKLLIAFERATQEFGDEPSPSWEMIRSAFIDFQQIEMRAAA